MSQFAHLLAYPTNSDDSDNANDFIDIDNVLPLSAKSSNTPRKALEGKALKL